MVPREILRRIGQLRRRERMLRLVWGAACLLAAVVAVVIIGCLVDYLWDGIEDTPRMIRTALLSITGLAAVLGFLTWVAWPQVDRLRDDTLALWVEEKHPAFRNRLISAVQLNRPGADRRGMSVELIDVMTRQAETQAAQTAFAAVADHRRLNRSLKVLAPVLVVAAGFFVWRPDVAPILVARHFLADAEIPRRTRIEPSGIAAVVPAGEKIPLHFSVSGEGFDESTEGVVDVTHTDLPRDRYPLKFSHQDAKTGQSIFAVEVAPTSFDFAYRARIGDGRMKAPGHVKVVPRPAVIEQAAWTLLPEYCGLTPSGARYELPQARGDVAGIPGSTAKVQVDTQKPITKAKLEILGPEKFDPKNSSEETVPEVVKRMIECDLAADQKSAIGEFDLRPDETGYRVIVTDEYGFENVPPPRRNLRVIPEEPPTVVLLKDYFVPGKIGAKESLEDFAIEGMPVPVGADLRVPYLAEGPYGLGQAWFLYRILKKTESGNDIVEEEPFKRLPLPEVKQTAKTGGFDPRRGVFENTPPDKSVDFFALPSPDPERILGRTTGGGRVHFKTKGIPDGKGGIVQLKDGDRIEYCVEIHADKGKNPGRPVVRSETRIQELGSTDGLIRWIRDLAQEERRLRELDAKQKGVFANP